MNSKPTQAYSQDRAVEVGQKVVKPGKKSLMKEGGGENPFCKEKRKKGFV